MRGFTRRAFLPVLLAASFTFSGFAIPAHAEGEAPIDQPLTELYAALEKAMRAGKAMPFTQRFDMLAPAVDRTFDLDTILKVSVGLRWESIDQAAQARLSKTFRRFTVASYVANFDKYDGEKFRIFPGSRDSGSDKVVRTEIRGATGDPIRLDYVMRNENDAWRAVDVLLDGSISRVAVQRSDFRKILAGGDVDALINSLRRKITDLSEGALRS